ncbi:MAG: restriction endonuclease subunit S [Pseudomonadota bacterium]|nr:restriction endonuclease subunit S [Pseudomonadota bacterium]
MSEANFLEKLLGGAEVEWVPVAELFHLKNGYTPSKSKKEFWEGGNIPWFRMDDIRQNGRILDDSLQKITEAAVKAGKLFAPNSMIFSTSATIGEHALINVPYLANQRFTNLTVKEEYIETVDIKYLYYYGFHLADWCKKNTTMSSFASVDMDGFRKFEIPIPCPDEPERSLEIQKEIVRILDAFTAMTAELTAELTARKKQYNHYRDQLLTFNADEPNHFLEQLLGGAEVEWLPLGGIVNTVTAPAKLKKESYQETGSMPIIDQGASFITGYTDIEIKALPVDEYVIFGDHSEHIKYVDFSFVQGADGLKILKPKSANARYVYHAFQCLYKKELNYKRHWSKAKETFIPIPCPDEPERSLEIQKEIVRVLDKFDALTNSISEGLPREIELRQQQYEYYRDMLLNFPKPD